VGKKNFREGLLRNSRAATMNFPMLSLETLWATFLWGSTGSTTTRGRLSLTFPFPSMSMYSPQRHSDAALRTSRKLP